MCVWGGGQQNRGLNVCLSQLLNEGQLRLFSGGVWKEMKGSESAQRGFCPIKRYLIKPQVGEL